MTIKQKLEAQWNSPKLGSTINRVAWKLDGEFLVAKPGTRRGNRK